MNIILFLLVFLSGFSALVYQILWMKQLGLLFGSTSHAAGVTLAAFFAGLAAGSWFWGRRSTRSSAPLRVYAGLELGIVFAALPYFVVIQLYHLIYPEVYQGMHSGTWLLVIKFLLALFLIFPPAFCMGGTIPVIAQHAIRNPLRFGSTSALLYGINTFGAALGALLAGFFMPLWFGFRGTYFIAMGITGAVAVIAYMASRKPAAVIDAGEDPAPLAQAKSSVSTWSGGRLYLAVICFLSGFGVLALEVLWTRMFALVLENSVYTFAAILVVVLTCLAGGSMISSFLARRKWRPHLVLAVLLVMSGVSIAMTPGVFMALTDSFQFQSVKMSWSGFVLLVFQKCVLIMGPPALVLGAVFPYLMKTEEKHAGQPGATLGRLAMINTVGAILGSLACAFLFLELFGMWRTMQIIGVIYFVLALCMPSLRSRAGMMVKGVGGVALILWLTVFNPSQLPVTGALDSSAGEETLKAWQGSDFTVSVVRGDDGLSVRINSDYGLGATGGRDRLAMQAELPLMLKPDTQSVFFLGVGTGITAGAALADRFPEVERVVVCELSPHVITAAREFMTDVDGVDFTNGLFTDSRVTVLTEDGRHYLAATREKYDLINSDLFVPYQAGTGGLYSKEHFEVVKQRLNPGGLFVQWLPAYQLTSFDFHVIGRTMLEVFEQVSIWRCDFAPFDEVVAFVGHPGGVPLAASDIDDSGIKRDFAFGGDHDAIEQTLNPQTALLYYVANITAARDLFAEYPVNTDDRPIIEYMAPRSYRSEGEDQLPWFVGPYLLRFFKDVQEICPPDEDPLLVQRTPANRRLPLAGSAYHETRLWAMFGNMDEAEKSWMRFLEEWLEP